MNWSKAIFCSQLVYNAASTRSLYSHTDCKDAVIRLISHVHPCITNTFVCVCVWLMVWVNTICDRYSVSRHTTHVQHPRVTELRRPRLLGDHLPTLLCSRASSMNYCITPTDTHKHSVKCTHITGQTNTHKSLFLSLYLWTHKYREIQTSETKGWRMAVISYELDVFGFPVADTVSEISVEQHITLD